MGLNCKCEPCSMTHRVHEAWYPYLGLVPPTPTAPYRRGFGGRWLGSIFFCLCVNLALPSLFGPLEMLCSQLSPSLCKGQR